MELRRRIIKLEGQWTQNTAEEEFSPYIDKNKVRWEDVYAPYSAENVTNPALLHRDLLAKEEDVKKYNFVNYMSEHWDNPVLKFKK